MFQAKLQMLYKLRELLVDGNLGKLLRNVWYRMSQHTLVYQPGLHIRGLVARMPQQQSGPLPRGLSIALSNVHFAEGLTANSMGFYGNGKSRGRQGKGCANGQRVWMQQRPSRRRRIVALLGYLPGAVTLVAGFAAGR